MNRLTMPQHIGHEFNSKRIAHRTKQSSVSEKTFAFKHHHQIFTPLHYEPGYDYPLVVWLHSDDSSELELGSIISDLSPRNYVAISVRGTVPGRQGKPLFRWGLRSTSVAVAEEIILDAIQGVSQHRSINPGNVFLAGYGRGGTLAQMIGYRFPERFAGVVSINGPFPDAPRVLSRWKVAKSLPVLWMHGNESTQCGIESLCDMLSIAHAAGLQVHPVQFACTDGLDVAMLTTANRFMMQIVTGDSIRLNEPVRSQ